MTFSQNFYPGNIPGCVARWSFDEGSSAVIADVSGNNNNDMPFSILPAAGWHNRAGKAGNFNGTYSYVVVPDAASLQIHRA